MSRMSGLKTLLEESLFGTVLISLPIATAAWSQAHFALEAVPQALLTFFYWTVLVCVGNALAAKKRAKSGRRRGPLPRLDY